MNKELLETYSDYLISSFSYTTATGLSGMLDGAISHDKITRFLATEAFDAKSLWKTAEYTTILKQGALQRRMVVATYHFKGEPMKHTKLMAELKASGLSRRRVF
jgi:hypothetical protein